MWKSIGFITAYPHASWRIRFRCVYRIPAFDAGRIFWWVDIGLFIFALFVIGILVFLKVRLVRPFMHLSSLPEALAGGHFRGTIREEKNKYMSGFLRSNGRMKDSLDISRKRQMELEREKKKLLLSLSHDIKTPLNTIRLYGRALEENLYRDEEKKLHAMHQIGVKAEEIERYVEEIMKNPEKEFWISRSGRMSFICRLNGQGA